MNSRRAFTMTELLIAIVLLSLAIIPAYNLFTQSRKAVFRSRVSYLAMHAARDLMAELRQIPFEKLEDVASAYSGYRRLDEKLFAFSMRYRNSKSDAAKTLERFTYPPEYRRIKILVEVMPIGTEDFKVARLARVRLRVLWEETGEDLAREKRMLGVQRTHFDTIIARYGPGM